MSPGTSAGARRKRQPSAGSRRSSTAGSFGCSPRVNRCASRAVARAGCAEELIDPGAFGRLSTGHCCAFLPRLFGRNAAQSDRAPRARCRLRVCGGARATRTEAGNWMSAQPIPFSCCILVPGWDGTMCPAGAPAEPAAGGNQPAPVDGGPQKVTPRDRGFAPRRRGRDFFAFPTGAERVLFVDLVSHDAPMRPPKGHLRFVVRRRSQGSGDGGDPLRPP